MEDTYFRCRRYAYFSLCSSMYLSLSLKRRQMGWYSKLCILIESIHIHSDRLPPYSLRVTDQVPSQNKKTKILCEIQNDITLHYIYYTWISPIIPQTILLSWAFSPYLRWSDDASSIPPIIYDTYYIGLHCETSSILSSTSIWSRLSYTERGVNMYILYP